MQLAGKQSAGQRDPSENADFLLLSTREEKLRRALAKTVEDDLHRLNVGEFDGFEGLFDFLYANAVVADLAGSNQIVEDTEHLRAIVEFARGAVELQQVDCVGREIAEAVIDPCGQVRARVAFHGLTWETAPGLSGNDDFFFAFLAQAGDEALAASVSVDVGSVDEIDAAVDGFVQGGERVFVGHGSPGATDGPGAKADFRDVPTSAAERAFVHGSS